MIDIREIIEREDIFHLDEKLRWADWFYKYYQNYSTQDIYCWLWMGEFGYDEFPPNDLSTLKRDIRLARLHPSRVRKIWEPIGISKKFVKINLDLYADADYPLLRLIDLVDRVKNFQNVDKLTFKNNWNLMKIQLTFTQKVTLHHFNEFQEKIPFHMTPFYPFTESFLEEFGKYFRIVPMDDFFEYYPECSDFYEEIFIDMKSYILDSSEE